MLFRYFKHHLKSERANFQQLSRCLSCERFLCIIVILLREVAHWQQWHHDVSHILVYAARPGQRQLLRCCNLPV